MVSLALLCVMVFLCFCRFPIWCPGSGVILGCIDSTPLPSSLLCFRVGTCIQECADKILLKIPNYLCLQMLPLKF